MTDDVGSHFGPRPAPFSDRLKILVDVAATTSRGLLVEHKRLMPVCLLFRGDRSKVQVIGLPEFAEAKAAATELLRMRARLFKATDAIFIFEAWCLTMTTPAGTKEPGDFSELQRRRAELSPVLPSEHPDRGEAVIFSVQSYEGHWCGMAPLERTGASVTFADVLWSAASVSRFDEILPPLRN